MSANSQTTPTPGSHPTATAPGSDPASDPGFLERHHFLLRRLHSLSGIMPIGVFVIFHLFTNAQIAFSALGLGGDRFQHEVGWIHSLPALLFLEVFGIWVPIGFHAALGIAYTVTGKANVRRYKHSDNVRYLFQRITGIVALVFIFLHIATLRWGWNIFGWYTPFFFEAVGPHGEALVAGPNGEPLGLASTSVAVAFNGGPQHAVWAMALVLTMYVIGVLAVVYHWSNGLWTAAISWGVTTSVASMRRWGYVCAAMGIVLALFFGGALYGSVMYEPSAKEMDAWHKTVQADAQGGMGDPTGAAAEAAMMTP